MKYLLLFPIQFIQFAIKTALHRLVWITVLIAVFVVVAINLFARQPLPDDPLDQIRRSEKYSPAKVEEIYERLLDKTPLDLELNRSYIEQHFKQTSGRNDTAIEARYTRLSTKPETADIGYYGLGLVRSYQKNYQEALDNFQKVQNRNQKYLNDSTGSAYRELGDEKQAEEYYWREIDLGGNVPGAVDNLAGLYLKRRDLAKTRALLQDARTRDYVSYNNWRTLAFLSGDAVNYLWLAFVVPILFVAIKVIGALAALLICVMFLLYFWRMHLFERRPIWAALIALGLGAFSALFAVVLQQEVLAFISPLAPSGNWLNDFMYFIVHVGLTEEFAKFTMVVLIVVISRQVKEPIDFLIYGSLVGLGFATLESSLELTSKGLVSLGARFIGGSVLHMAYTSIVCYAWAQARYRQSRISTLGVLGGFGIAVGVHALQDFLASKLLLLAYRWIGQYILVAFIAAAYGTMIHKSLSASPSFTRTLSLSQRQLNSALMVSNVIILLLLAFIYNNYNYSTDQANTQFMIGMLLDIFPAVIVFSALGSALGGLSLTPQQATDALKSFFGVLIKPQSYLNILYLLMEFPLGLFYFVFLATGLALGVGLSFVCVGIPILILMLIAWWGMAAFERQLAIWFLRQEIPPLSRPWAWEGGLAQLKAHLKNSVTWKSLVYLFAKFPLGILSFVVSITLIALTLALVTVPFTYNKIPTTLQGLKVDTPGEAVIISIVGIAIGLVSLHVMNGLASVSARFARRMLS